MGEYCVAFFDVTALGPVFSDEFPDYIEHINKRMLPPANSTIIKKNQGRRFIQNLIAVILLLGCVEIVASAKHIVNRFSTAGKPQLYFSMHYFCY